MKKNWKRLLSAGLVIALVITMVNIIPRNNTMDVTHAAEETTKEVRRGVVYSLDELPQYKDSAYLNLPRGTENHPFVVLEIVPYEEYAEFGYLISGCEPMDTSLLHADEGFYGAINSLNVYEKVPTAWGWVDPVYTVYFFSDEPESDESLYWSTNNDGSRTNVRKEIKYDQYYSPFGGFLNGYYELVEPGTGTFQYEKTLLNPSVSGNDIDGSVSGNDIDSSVSGNNIVPSVSGDDIDSSVSDNDIVFSNGGGSVSANNDSGLTFVVEYIDSVDSDSDDKAENEVNEEQASEEADEEVNIDDNDAESETDSNGDLDNNDDADNNDDVDSNGDADSNGDSDNNGDVDSNGDVDNNGDVDSNGDVDQNNKPSDYFDDTTLFSDEFQTVSGNDGDVGEIWEVTIRRQDGGNLIWHTVNGFEEDANATFEPYSEELLQNNILNNIGERLYTTRAHEKDDTVYCIENYHIYKNQDNFLKVSMGLTDKQAENYSIVVKTITPNALNQNPAWVDFADLIVLSPKSHVGALPVIWMNLHGGEAAHTDDKGFDREGYDLSWDVVYRIYNKVTATTNYAGIIIDDGIYNYTNTTKYSAKIYDYNLRPSGQSETISVTANNVYKLCVMLLSMDSTLFKQLYMPLINAETGVFKLREDEKDANGKDLSKQWGFGTFYLMEPNSTRGPWEYWNDDDQWAKYGTWANATEEKYKLWCNEHVFTFNGTSSIAQKFNSEDLLQNRDRDAYSKRFDDFFNSLSDEEKNNIYPSLAVRYILNSAGNSENEPYGSDMTIHILDLEPSVGLLSDGNPDWYYRESYFHMLLPHFTGKIEVTHQTTAEFIGKIEDLNTTYQMIYMGLDFSAYNTAPKVTGKNAWGGDISELLPNWNDNSMDGKIYFRIGDRMISAEHTPSTGRNRSVKWLLQSNGSVLNSDELRFSGNDISLLKESELFEFLKAGYPIIADVYLYNLDSIRIDSSTYVYDFIYKNREYANLLSTSSSPAAIEASVKNSLKSVVQFNVLPNQYNGSTGTEDSPYVTDANYLPSGDLTFKFTVTPAGTEKYKYRIFVDQNRDSKFSDDEAVYTSTVVLDPEMAGQTFPKTYEYSYPIDSDWVGLIQWKIEVYEVRYVYDGNGNHVYDYQYGYDSNGNYGIIGQTYAVTETGTRYAATGQSAKRNTSGAKKQINVLQIMPKEIDYNNIYAGALDLSVDPRFTKYYNKLADYDISVDTITWAEFESYFYKTDAWGNKVSRGFIYDYTKETDSKTNPVNLGEVGGNLDNYNMFIIGFGDTYGGINLSNDYGAIDYLRYYVDQGKSILFTHDLTSMYNVESETFGYTVDALMRDLMGMNRYGSVSSQADNAGNTLANKWICTNCGYVHQAANTPARCPGCRATDSFVKFSTESSMLKTYQSANASLYDKTNSSAKHGYTYYSMKRLGWNNSADNSGGGVMPYRYTIINPAGLYVLTDDKHGKTTGFNNSNDLTTKVSMVNEGQVTSYPYKIGGLLTVAPTHGQWFALTPEDPEVTVWYALAGDPANINASDNGNDGTSLTYAVSPNDAMNNYYIYSKGNIFYSGVGHSTVSGDMEAKLFINTMIAAYNAGYVPPSMVVTNDEAVMSGEQRYSIELMQNYDYGDIDADGYYTQVVEDFDGEEYPVNFMPRDANLTKTQLECTIYYDIGGDDVIYVDRVVELTSRNGEPVRNADGSPKTLYANPTTHIFNNLENTKYYRIYYPKDYLSEPVHDIYFTIKNDRTNKTNITILNMNALPLFPLD